MGRATFKDHFDWMALNATFAGGVKVSVTWGRGGANVKVTPEDAGLASALSYVVIDAGKATGEGKPLKNLGDVARAMVATAERSATLGDYIGNLKVDLGVKGEAPKGRNAAMAPKTTQASIKPSRGGFLIKAFFPNGDEVELKLSPASVGLGMDPNIPSVANDLSKFAFGVKQSGILPPEDFAKLMYATSLESQGVADWVERAKAAVRPQAPRP